MINGSYSVPRVQERVFCKTSKDYELSEVGDYKIWSNSWMTNIEFGEAKEEPYDIDDSIFVNDEETKLNFEKTIDCQNYLTTKYVGRAPLEFYGPKTKMGRVFTLVGKEGDPSYPTRFFGTHDAIGGFNKDANTNSVFPGGDK
jgi:hypothetical protein